ncbi:MAG: hypothetical protein CM1200mP20_08430 [Pseudomonadota bacterium]|nr:MAG: hypothetical protein CM1200mP20_08430 [Pseudomonadota bacterium]
MSLRVEFRIRQFAAVAVPVDIGIGVHVFHPVAEFGRRVSRWIVLTDTGVKTTYYRVVVSSEEKGKR